MGILKRQIVASGHGPITPKYLVVHSTANPGATAANHISYWGGGEAKYYAHAVSDWIQAVQAVEWDRKCWHVGCANGFTVGIEICEGTTEQKRRDGLEIAAIACAEILKSFGWSVDKMLTHDDCRRRWGGTDHTDPLPYFKRCGITWAQFKAKVKGYLEPEKRPMPKQPESKAVNSNGFAYRAHVQRAGWLPVVHDGMTAGTEGYSARMEALKMRPPKGVVLDVDVHIQGDGWKTFKSISRDGADPIIGTTGQAKRLEAIRIRESENNTGKKLSYRVHVQSHGWMPWMTAGQVAGTIGRGLRMEAIQMKYE